MDLYSQKSKSYPQKTLMGVLQLLILLGSAWVLLGNGFKWLYGIFNYDYTIGNESRRILLFICNIILFIRMNITIFYFIKRRIPWEETLSVPMAFGVYYIGYAILGYQSTEPLDIWDSLALILFFSGSFFNTWGEWQRNQWKKLPENKGKLYTKGLFKYSMHINYFGDLLWVIGYAIITKNLYSSIIPILIFCFFAFYNIPKLDRYLAEKYGKEFSDYKQKTKKFIPFTY